MSPIIKKHHVTALEPDAAAAKPRRGHAKVARLLRVEGEVRAIEFLCTCGETTVLELEYAPVAAAPPAPETAPPSPEDSPS